MNIKFSNWNKNIYITEIYQEKTYLGLLEGYPNVKINNEIIQEAKINLCKKFYNPGKPIMILPDSEKVIVENITDYYKASDLKKIPDITCAMILESSAIDQNSDMSSIFLIWFQDEFCFPIDQSIINKLASLDWKQYAENFNI